MTTDAERKAFETWVRNGALFGAGFIFGPFYDGVLMVEVDNLDAFVGAPPAPQPEPVADDLVKRMRVQPWQMGSNDDDRRTRVIQEREEALARITSDAATIAAKDAEIERLRNYCGAAARDYAGTLAALEEAVGAPLLEYFPHTARDLRETSEFMALAAEGKEDPTRWGTELNDAKARITELQAEVERLREAMRRIPQVYEETGSWNANRWKVREIVRAALNTGESDEK